MESCKKLEFINPVTAKAAPLQVADHVELEQPSEVVPERINMSEILATGQPSIMPMSTTTPYGHSSTFIGSNYRLTGRNLLIVPYRAGSRIASSAENASNFKLYNKSGRLIQSGRWDSTSPYGACIAFNSISDTEESFTVRYIAEDGIPCYHQGYDLDSEYAYSPRSSSQQFNNYADIINLPTKTQITVTCMGRAMRNKEVLVSVSQGQHFYGRSNTVRTNSSGIATFNIRNGDTAFVMCWNDDNNSHVNDCVYSNDTVAPFSGTIPVPDNTQPTLTNTEILGPLVQDGVRYYNANLEWIHTGASNHQGYIFRVFKHWQWYHLGGVQGVITGISTGYLDMNDAALFVMAVDNNGFVYARARVEIPV